jgi:hypothetical protein
MGGKKAVSVRNNASGIEYPENKHSLAHYYLD